MCQEFRNRFTGGVEFPPSVWRRKESKILLGVTFLLGGGNLRRTEFDHSKVFKAKKNII